MAELESVASESARDHAASRDAWAVDGFAPLPGDRVHLPVQTSGGGEAPAPAATEATVQTVYLCSEPDGRQVVRWSWIVLEDGRLLEIAPRGCALYEPPTLLLHGSGRFLELAAQDGALVRFEERVQAGEWQSRPVRLTLQRRRWRVSSTGTVTAQRLGPTPAGGWGQLRTGNPPASLPPVAAPSPWQVSSGRIEATGATLADPAARGADLDVYFTLAGESDPRMLGLGVWMTDIALAFGRRLGDTPRSAGLRALSDAADAAR